MKRQIEVRTGIRKTGKRELSEAASSLLGSIEDGKQTRLHACWETDMRTWSKDLPLGDPRLRAEGKQARAAEFMLRRAFTIR